MTNTRTSAGRPHRRGLRTGLVLAALLALGACSDMHGVRDRANPGAYSHARAFSNTDARPAHLGTVQAIEAVRIPHSGRTVGQSAGTRTSDAYRITVRMHDGRYQALTQTHDANLRVGDQVQVANGVAQPYR